MATNTAAGGSVFEVGARSILTGLGTPLVMLLLLVMIVLPLPPYPRTIRVWLTPVSKNRWNAAVL